ncbi:hypothetical protein JCM10450v2_002778 [Rhodotorula kratochvilovae]
MASRTSSALARSLQRIPTRRAAPTPPAAPLRAFSLSPPAHLARTAPLRTDAPLPWFVDPATAPSASPTPAPQQLATAPVPTPPPAHLPPALHPLHAHLSTSPFLDRDSLAYIHAREADPEGSWCDWVVCATLKEGRERGIRGAVEGVRRHLAAHPVDLSPPSSSPPDLPFAPPSSSPLIHGLPPSPSKHARARALRSRSSSAAPTRSDNASGWAMLDAGTVVVHVFSREGRETYGAGIEELWEAIGGEERGEGWVSGRRRGEEERRRREMEDNLEAVRGEVEFEREEAARERR